MEFIRINVDGITAEIDPRVVRDYRTFVKLANIAKAEEAGDEIQVLKAVPDFADSLFGREQFARILDELAARDGYADIDTVQRFIVEAFNAAARGDEAPHGDDLKNS